MKDDIENALTTIDDDYSLCVKMIKKIYDYLEKFDLKEFNRYSQYKWSYDRDKKKGYAYVCIRYGSSLSKKVEVKRRALVEDADLARWVEHKELIEEAMDEAYQYVYDKVNTVKNKIEALKASMEEYKEKLDDVSKDYEEVELAKKELRWEEFPGEPEKDSASPITSHKGKNEELGPPSTIH